MSAMICDRCGLKVTDWDQHNKYCKGRQVDAKTIAGILEENQVLKNRIRIPASIDVPEYFMDWFLGLSHVVDADGKIKVDAGLSAAWQAYLGNVPPVPAEPPPNPGIKKPGPADPGPGRSVSSTECRWMRTRTNNARVPCLGNNVIMSMSEYNNKWTHCPYCGGIIQLDEEKEE